MGFVFVVGSLVATAYLSEILLPDDYSFAVVHLLVPVGAYATVVIVTAVVLRRSAPKPGLGVGLLEGAAWALLLMVLAVPALLFACFVSGCAE